MAFSGHTFRTHVKTRGQRKKRVEPARARFLSPGVEAESRRRCPRCQHLLHAVRQSPRKPEQDREAVGEEAGLCLSYVFMCVTVSKVETLFMFLNTHKVYLVSNQPCILYVSDFIFITI